MVTQAKHQKHHNIIIENRKRMVIEGVKEVESFSPTDIIIITHSGALRIRGKSLEITKMNIEDGDNNAGLVEMSGFITALNYSDHDRTPNNIITKLFR